jgi:GT2 family glycosyltransferase
LKACICLINYYSKKELLKLLNSLPDEAVSLDIYVFDNTEERELKMFNHFRIHKLISDGLNKGYFGRVNEFITMIDKKNYNFYLYGNCDILFTKDFFKNLFKTNLETPSVIAPKILSVKNDFNLNPKYEGKPKKVKIKRLKIIFKNRILFDLYQRLAKIKSHLLSYLNSGNEDKKRTIYCPHGSILIFNHISALKLCNHYSIFLFGEEIFLSENCLKSNTPIWYIPKLVVSNIGEVSISKSTKINSRYVESLDFILKNYYN